jgi:glycosyltransferase involved in cell wall biosynthesis
MRTLLLTQVVPSPGDAGPRIKTHYALRTLAERHEVELVTFTRDAVELAAARQLEEFCARVTTVPLHRRKVLEPYYALRGWATLTPFLVQRDQRRAMARAVRDRLAAETFDVVHADQLSMAAYLPLAGSARTVFDAHNAVYELVQDVSTRQPTPVHRAAASVEWRMLRRYEGQWARGSDLTLTVSARDAHALASAAGRPINAVVVPIGIEARDRSPVTLDPDSRRILSVATMHYPPNAEALRWFRDAVWPLLRSTDPLATVDVAGPRPPADVVAWGERDERVRVHGFVDDLDALYSSAAVFIVPLHAGSGVRVKVLEALAAGVPVVSTTVGIDGLELVAGEHLLVADRPAEFAQAVQTLLAEPELRQRLALAGRRRVVECYDWRVCCRPLLDAYEQLARAARPVSVLAAGHP